MFVQHTIKYARRFMTFIIQRQQEQLGEKEGFFSVNESNGKAEMDFEKEAHSVKCGPCRVIQEDHVAELTP